MPRIRRGNALDWDVRYVLNSYNAAKSKEKQHVKNPTAWINGILKRMADQSLVTPPEWDSLLLSLDDLDIGFKARIPLKQIPLEEGLVKTLRKDLATIKARRNGVEMYLRLQIQEVKAEANWKKQKLSPSTPKKEPSAEAKVPEAMQSKQLVELKMEKSLLPPPIPAPPEPEAAKALAANGPEGATKVSQKKPKNRKQNKHKSSNQSQLNGELVTAGRKTAG